MNKEQKKKEIKSSTQEKVTEYERGKGSRRYSTLVQKKKWKDTKEKIWILIYKKTLEIEKSS